jgi:hypothetical protein
MLDSASIITYVINREDDPQTSDKIYRNMFHFGNNILIQGRVYPQGNDGSTDLYTTFRQIVQNALAPIMGLSENLWTRSNDSPTDWVVSYGVHYRDYDHFKRYCNVSYPSERKHELRFITIGHNGICPSCGREYSSSGVIVCPSCS